MKFEIGDEIVNVNNGKKAIVFHSGKPYKHMLVFNEKGFIYILNYGEWKKTGRRYADIDLLKYVRGKYKYVGRSTIWPGDEIRYNTIDGHEMYGVVISIFENYLKVKNYDGHYCIIDKALCVRTNYKVENININDKIFENVNIDDKILNFINTWQNDNRYIKEEVPMTNLEKYKKELDEVQKKLKDLKKKIDAESIEIGDEVTFDYGDRKGIVCCKHEYNDCTILNILALSSEGFDDYYVNPDSCAKTGRHFDGIDDLTKFLSKS